MSSRMSVVLIALNGPTEPLYESVAAASAGGLACHVLIEKAHETSLREGVRRLNVARDDVSVVPIDARRIQPLRHRVRKGSARAIGTLDSRLNRTIASTAHRLQLSSGATTQVESIGRRLSSAVSRLATAAVDRLLDPLLRVVGSA
ncbi:MAG TPA: hypothetical protein VI141_01625, partial [Acidimicrobiia bacterium]